ncbi:MAG: hypothetical protein KIT17_15410 [Rubrivivax sp.]|nr:hypothetical protein [Rubrivivax sp.]
MMLPAADAHAALARADAERKRFASLQAAYAIAGHELVRGEGGELFACKWGMAKRLRDLDDAEAFLQRIGGAPA